METFIFPTLALLHTGLARACLQYRADRSLAAVYNARDSGEVGMCFPWQSGVTGRSTDGCGDEQHITGDIAVAVWQYWRMTHDVEWLTNTGWPLLRGKQEHTVQCFLSGLTNRPFRHLAQGLRHSGPHAPLTSDSAPVEPVQEADFPSSR